MNLCSPVTMDWVHSTEPSWVFINTVEIDASCAQTFFCLCDPDAWPQFFPGMVSVKWTSPDPKKVGTTRTVVFDSGLSVAEEFLVWEENKRYAFRFFGMSKPYFEAGVEDYVLDELDGGCRCKFTYKVYIKPLLFLRLVSCLGVKSSQARNFAAATLSFQKFVNNKFK